MDTRPAPAHTQHMSTDDEREAPARDFSQLPAAPGPEQWVEGQDVSPLDPGPGVRTFEDDGDYVLRHLLG